ncbi:hypothetical protein, partial [Bradyrhizobium sp. UFLA05-112]
QNGEIDCLTATAEEPFDCVLDDQFIPSLGGPACASRGAAPNIDAKTNVAAWNACLAQSNPGLDSPILTATDSAAK